MQNKLSIEEINSILNNKKKKSFNLFGISDIKNDYNYLFDNTRNIFNEYQNNNEELYNELVTKLYAIECLDFIKECMKKDIRIHLNSLDIIDDIMVDLHHTINVENNIDYTCELIGSLLAVIAQMEAVGRLKWKKSNDIAILEDSNQNVYDFIDMVSNRIRKNSEGESLYKFIYAIIK